MYVYVYVDACVYVQVYVYVLNVVVYSVVACLLYVCACYVFLGGGVATG